MTNELRRVTDELENLKSAISISEQSKTEEIQSIEERCEQDLLSLRQIMKGSFEYLIIYPLWAIIIYKHLQTLYIYNCSNSMQIICKDK